MERLDELELKALLDSFGIDRQRLGQDDDDDLEQAVTAYGDRFASLANESIVESQAVERILAFPDALVAAMPEVLVPAFQDQIAVTQETELLAAHGVVREDGRLTPLGARIGYHLTEMELQSRYVDAQELLTIDEDSVVLDIGCGAGQTLRAFDAETPRRRIGIDTDLRALALGARMSSDANLKFLGTNGTRLPFGDAAFSHVINRVALNYMPQDEALAEMTRVVAPGGQAYLHVESAGYDLRRLLNTRGPKALAARAYEFAMGAAAGLTPHQMPPGSSRYAGRRSYVPTQRLTARLEAAGFSVEEVRPLGNCFGLTESTVVIARRDRHRY